MTNQSPNRKISQLVRQTAIPSGAKFTYIHNNTNYSILDSDFFASLGVTGTIVQEGDVAGTPILNTAGTVNNIRNIEDGSGVKASVSAEGGVQLDHNFQADATGVELVVDLAADSPKFKSLVAGAGINIASSNGTIQVTLSTAPVSTKTVIINSISDFPAAVGGIITLADNTEYAVRNDISTSNRFVVGNNCVIGGSDEAVVTLGYTGVGIMFTSVDKTWKIKSITIDCSAGTFIDISGTTTEVFQFVGSLLICDKIGSIADMLGMQISDLQISATTDGVLFSGSFGVALIEDMLATIDAGTFFDLGTSTFSGLSITDCFTTINGTSVYLDGAASSANLNAGGLGSVHNCRFFGTGTPLATITIFDARWQFFINDQIPDTHQDSLLSLVGNVTATTIPAANTPVLIAGTWNLEHSSHYTQSAAGRSTYDGLKDTHVDITMSFTAEPVSGTNKIIGFYAAVNGTEISNSEATSNISAGSPKRVTVVWRVAITPGDYIEAFVENETDATDILVSDAVLRVS